jgi:hypothetical protein
MPSGSFDPFERAFAAGGFWRKAVFRRNVDADDFAGRIA